MTAEQIVRALAAADPQRHISGTAAAVECCMCRATLGFAGGEFGAVDHPTDCPWRLAGEWVEGHATRHVPSR